MPTLSLFHSLSLCPRNISKLIDAIQSGILQTIPSHYDLHKQPQCTSSNPVKMMKEKESTQIEP